MSLNHHEPSGRSTTVLILKLWYHGILLYLIRQAYTFTGLFLLENLILGLKWRGKIWNNTCSKPVFVEEITKGRMNRPASKRGRGSVESPQKKECCLSCKKIVHDDAIQCKMCGDWEHSFNVQRSAMSYMFCWIGYLIMLSFLHPVFFGSSKSFEIV